MKVYIAGPMTGYEDWNRPAFAAAAKHLRSLGYEVVNPAELDEGLSNAELAEIPHAVFMRRDILALLRCDAIYLLPGWAHSKGASLEARVAEETGILRLEEHNKELWRTFEGEPLDMDRVAEVLDKAEAHFSTVGSVTVNGHPLNPLPSAMAVYIAEHGNSIDQSIDEHHRR